MAIRPKCCMCKKELVKPGALFLSPPNENDRVEKYHLCGECYPFIISLIKLTAEKM